MCDCDSKNNSPDKKHDNEHNHKPNAHNDNDSFSESDNEHIEIRNRDKQNSKDKHNKNKHKCDEYNHKKCTSKVFLDVIAVVSNPARYDKRYKLFKEFCVRMKQQPQVRLLTVELQQRARPFVTDSIVKLRTKDELWHKENMINIGVQHLPEDWEYMAWIDTDLEFQNKNWVRETIEQLQTYYIVQLFQHGIDLGPSDEVLTIHTSFISLYVNGEPMNNYTKHKNYKNGHTGFCFAIRKTAFNDIGGLLDFAILGSADAHMCLAFIGDVKKSLHPRLNKNYKELCVIFQDRCERHIQRNVGYVNGTILHHFHGSKSDRQYGSRWQILLDNDYDPLRDIKKDWRGVYQLEDTKFKLRDQIKKYFRSRNEDAVLLNEDTQFTKAKWI